jgi:hypothetical protein
MGGQVGAYDNVAYVVGMVVLLSIGGIVLFWFIARMLGRRLTGDLDSMKSELSRKLEVHRLLHQYRADAIDKLYIMLAKVARETMMIADYHKGPPDAHRQFKMSVLATTFNQLADHVHENKLYFPDNITSRTQAFLTDLREAIDSERPSIITYYTTNLHAAGQADRWSKLNYDLSLLLNDIQNLARGIIGLNSQGEPGSEYSFPETQQPVPARAGQTSL